MAEFYVYGDESGKLTQSDITSFCGYVGHALEFERTMTEWNNCRFAWGVPPLHRRYLIEPERDKSGEWQEIKARWGQDWERKRDAMLDEFGRILRDSHLAAVGSVVDAAYFRSMPDSNWKKGMKDPLFLGLFTLLMESLDRIDVLNRSMSLAVVIDDDPQYAKDCYDLLTQLKNMFPRVRERISAITFADDKQYPALQMADLIAHESRSLMLDRQRGKKAEPSSLYISLTRRGIHQPKFWTGESLDAAANGKKTPPVQECV
jgi:hypothetical protein